MRRVLLALALLLIAWPAAAQLSLTGAGSGGNKSAAAPFSGPCDQGVTCTDGWGAERLTSAYAGKLLNACLAATPATCADISADAGGGLSSTDLTSLGCSANGTCRVGTFYSQFSGCNPTQATNASRANINVTSTQNGHATINYDNSSANQIYACNESFASASASLIAMLGPNTSSGAAFGTCGQSGGTSGSYAATIKSTLGDCQFALVATTTSVFSTTANNAGVNKSSSGVTQPASLYCGIAQGSTSVSQAVVNGTTDTNNNPSTTLNRTDAIAIGATTTAGGSWKGDIEAFILISPGVNNTNATTVAHSMATFWQASPSC